MAKVTKQLVCDYLVVGAGAASIAFVDTLLSELPSAKVILVDKNSAPGGHWLNAYGFVRLHQPSLLYGVASRQLEGNWARLMLTKFMYPWHHRATKQEILTHFEHYVNDKVAEGRLEFYPRCVYDFERENEGIYSFSTSDGTTSYSVKVNAKVVNGVVGAPIIPSRKS
jgi:cation diffusion facilitator CzcD-associated flavoprotein CzcO